MKKENEIIKELEEKVRLLEEKCGLLLEEKFEKQGEYLEVRRLRRVPGLSSKESKFLQGLEWRISQGKETEEDRAIMKGILRMRWL